MIEHHHKREAAEPKAQTVEGRQSRVYVGQKSSKRRRRRRKRLRITRKGERLRR